MDWQQTPSNPTDEAIEAVIQQATSALPYSRSNPLRDTRTQLFVGNLPYRVRWQDLKDLFRKAGTVLRADVSLGPDNRSRGYGTVLLATAEDAGRAVDTFNGYSWQSRILEVRLDRQLQDFDSPLPSVGSSSNSSYPPQLSSVPKSPSITDDPDYLPPPATELNSCRSLFVGNLPFHCQWQDLKDLFRQAGTIIRADVVLGPDGRSRGFGTVIFATDLDAKRALKMFDGYEFNGRILNVHHDKYSYSSQPETTSTSPVGGSSSGVASHPHPTHITLPPGYMLDLVPPSGPTSPYDMSKYQHHQHLHDQQQHQHQRQIHIQQLHLQLQQQEQEQRLLHQQYQHHHQQQQQHQGQRHQQQHRSHSYNTPSLLDIENPSDTLPKPTASTTTSTHYSNLPSSSSSSSSRPSSTSSPSTIKHPIPIYKPPPLSHTNTTSSGSDRSGSDIFSRLSSTSVTSAASSAPESSLTLSRLDCQGQGQGHSYGQVSGQGQRPRGQPFQTSSPHSVSSPEPSHSASVSVSSSASSHPHSYPHSGSHHRSFQSHSPSPYASSFQPSLHSTSNCRPSSRPSSSNPNHHPQRPGPISLPPPLLPSQVAFSIPLQQLSPHGHTPLGMSVSVSVSPMVEYPGGFGYVSGQYQPYQQHQQFGQHTIPLQATTPHGLPPITPSMPSFFLPPALAPGLHATPTGTSPRVRAGSRGSGGLRPTRSRSKSLARRLKTESELGNVGDDEDENVLKDSNNANASASGSSGHSSSPSASPPPPPSSVRQRHHHHHHQQQQHQNQQQYIPTHMHMLPTQDQQYHHHPTRRSAGDGSNGQPPPNVSNTSNQLQPQPQPIPMHISLTSIPGAFSPGVVMSPGTFYGRPGEAPTFINAAVGAPLTTRDGGGSGGGGGGGEGGGGPAAAQMQGQAQSQWYHQNQTHGAYFYAMSSPTRRTPTGMEPKGYFDPLFFPAGVSVSGGYNSSVVNEIMKDGHAHSLGVEVGPALGRKREGTGGEGEEERHISNGNDEEEEEDSGDGDADDDSGGNEGEEENQKVQSPISEGEDGDRKLTTGALFGNSGETSISRTQSLPAPDAPHHNHHQHTWRSMDKGIAGILEFQSDSEEALENARSVQIPKNFLGGEQQQQLHEGEGCGQDESRDDEFGTLDIPPAPVRLKTTTTSLKENGDSSLV